MKKTLGFTVTALMFIASMAYTQVYVKGGIGYALSLGGMQIDRDRTETSTGDQFKYHYGTFGAGLGIGGAVGYEISPNTAIELGV